MLYFRTLTLALTLFGFILVLLSADANARVTRSSENKFLRDAYDVGRCHNEAMLQMIEKIYNHCGASDQQYEKLYNSFDEGASAGSCEPAVPALIKQKYIIDIEYGNLEC